MSDVAKRSGWAGERRNLISDLATRYILRDERLAATRRYLEFAILPMWFLAGVADYACHRQSKIATTSGLKESAIHSMMIVESAIPVVAGLVLEANAGVLATALAALAAHEATAIWDVDYAVTHRRVTPAEQHIHGALELVPFCALSFLICLHWDQFKALFGTGKQSAVMSLRPKKPPLPRAYVGGIMATTSTVALLYVEELWRCFDAWRKGLSGVDIPPEAREFYSTRPAAAETPRAAS